MREQRRYIIKDAKDKIENVLMKMNNCNYYYDGYDFRIYTDTEDYRILQEELEKGNIYLCYSGSEFEYTEEDLLEAKYFLLLPRTYCSEFSNEYGTEYAEETKCKCCGSGKTQISELYIDKRKMGKKDLARTYDNIEVISDRFYKVLVENDVTGIEFLPVNHKKDAKMENEPKLYQLKPMFVLPTVSEKTEQYKEDYCECCKKSGLLYRGSLYYNNESLSNAKDFNFTYEYFGAGWSGKQSIIVSHKVFRLCKENKINGANFQIVQMI